MNRPAVRSTPIASISMKPPRVAMSAAAWAWPRTCSSSVGPLEAVAEEPAYASAARVGSFPDQPGSPLTSACGWTKRRPVSWPMQPSDRRSRLRSWPRLRGGGRRASEASNSLGTTSLAPGSAAHAFAVTIRWLEERGRRRRHDGLAEQATVISRLWPPTKLGEMLAL